MGWKIADEKTAEDDGTIAEVRMASGTYDKIGHGDKVIAVSSYPDGEPTRVYLKPEQNREHRTHI